MEAPLTESNYLPELAGRIRAEHTAVADALEDSLRHAITAGELLIVAKAQVPLGQVPPAHELLVDWPLGGHFR
jgi:hypothetical protein